MDLDFLFRDRNIPTLAEIVLEMGDDQIIEKYGHRGVYMSNSFPGTFETTGSVWLRGEDRKMSIQAARICSDQGEIIGVVQTAQDITDRIKMEEEREKLRVQLFQAQKMQAIGTLAGGIAHDFNNILAVIIGYTEMARGKIMTANGDVLNHLDQVLKASDRAKSLVKQILTFSRRTEQEKKPLDLSPIVKEVIKLLRATIPSTIEIRDMIAPAIRSVLADPTQIHQVLMNLCTNAAQALREKGGVIGVSLQDINLPQDIETTNPELHPGAYVVLKVADTGAGIEPDSLGRIFDPFFTTKSKGEGTGLGLSVVYGIVKEYGGAVVAQSEPGSGAIFRIYLPALELEVERRNDCSISIPRGSERILFVDDEKELAEMGRHMLESLGYRAISMSDSEKALQHFLAEPFRYDVIITDMTMPGMTGLELSGEVLKIRPDMPMIICTGYNETITDEKAKRLGVRELLMKPLSLKEFATSIRRALVQKA